MKRTFATLLLFLVALAASVGGVGCTERRRKKVVNQELVRKYVSTQKTTPEFPLDLRFGDAVELIGYDLSSDRLRRGRPFTITWHWRVIKPLGDNWKQFSHLLDAEGHSRVNLDENRKLFGALPCSAWKAGQYVRDPQEVTVPEDWGSKGIEIRIGFWRDEERMAVTRGKADGESRARAFQARLGKRLRKPKIKHALPELEVPVRTGDIALDGKLKEDAWQSAKPTAPFVDTMQGKPGSFAAVARALYDSEALYVAFEVQDELLKTKFEKHDEHLWEQDTVEVMVDPDGDGTNYFEVQVSPRGVVFDTRYDARRDPRPFGHTDWDSELTNGVDVDGTIGDDEADKGYVVEMRIPWTAFAHGPKKAEPPKPGESWRVNLFVMDAQKQGQRAVGWSPPMIGDFHTLDRFGTWKFGGESTQNEEASAKPAAAKPATAKPAAAKPATAKGGTPKSSPEPKAPKP